MHRVVRMRCLQDTQRAAFGTDVHCGTAGSLQELADMDCFPGWDEYFQHPESLSMPAGGSLPEEEVNNNTANPYDSKDLTMPDTSWPLTR